jgi:2,3-bisphosphoglycerate-dependent phosphoglycerate mutase
MNNTQSRKIWFVRHAQSEYNEKQLFTGWHDPHLTEKGMAAAMNLQNELSSIEFNHVYSSPLLRAATTAICIVGDNISIEYDDRLKERSYGDWSGLNKSDVKKQIGEASFFSARRGWDTNPPNGESLKDVSVRVISFIESLPKSGNILVVSHGNTIRAISVILGINSKEDVSSYEIRTGTYLLVE